MHRIKQLLAGGSAALAVAGGLLALAGSANAATSLSVTLSSSGTGASAVWNSAGDPVLTVGSAAATFAKIAVNNPSSAAPAGPPTFTSSASTSTSPRWAIAFAGGDSLYGYANGTWQAIPASSGPCDVTEPTATTYLTALAFIQNPASNCGGNVSSAAIVADGGQAVDTITNINYGGLTLPSGPDVVSITAPGSQTSAVGTKITELDIKAASNKGDGISAFAATNLPPGLAIDSKSGAITGTPTTAGNFAVQVTATDNGGTKGSDTFAWLVSGGGPTTTYQGTIRLYKLGLCLDDRFNSSTSGSAVVQVWRCNGLSNQSWQVDSDGTIRHNNLCMTAAGNGTGNGTRIVLATCSGSAGQKWDTKGYRVHYDNPAASNKVLDDTAWGKGGTAQELYNNNGGKNQIWATF